MADQDRPRVVVLGARGQVGWELTRTLSPLGQVFSFDRGAIDLTNLTSLRAGVRAVSADVIVNAAAYTQVDRAESEPELANRINGEAVGVLAEEARRSGALLVHFSTDYVFDGVSDKPYTEQDTPSPRNVYGASKLAGDKAALASDADTYIFRVSWVYGRRGHNFLRTIQRLMLERDRLDIVADQHGSPTWSRSIAEVAASAVGRWLEAQRDERDAPPRGVYHVSSSNHTTWHGFAEAIVNGAAPREGWVGPVVEAVPSASYPTIASRPAWSVLDSTLLNETFGLMLPDWREQLALALDDE